MSLRDMPVAELRGFILIKAQMDAKVHLIETFLESQVGRRIVDRITSQH